MKSSVDDSCSNVVDELRNQFHQRLVGRIGFIVFSIHLVIIGLFVLIIRFNHITLNMNGGLCFALLLLFISFIVSIISRRKMPSDYSLVKLIDLHSCCGGALLASYETGRKYNSPCHLTIPKLQWRWLPTFQLLVGSLCFLIGTAFVPLPEPVTSRTVINLSGEQQLIEGTVDELEDVGAISQDKAEEYLEKLEEIVQNQTDDASEIWEAIDSLNEALMEEAQEASKSAVWKYEQLSYISLAAEEVSQLMEQGVLGSDDPAVKELSAMLEKFLSENGESLGKNGKEMQEMMSQAGGMSMSELSEMIKSMNLSKEEIEKLMKKLAESGKNGQNSGQQAMQEMKKLTNEDLKKFLENEGKCQGGSCSALMMACQGNGTPSISRGPGHSPIQFGAPVDETGGKFKAVALPEGTVTSLKDSELEGVSIAAPKLTVEQQIYTNQLNNMKSDGGTAIRFRPLPRHKKAVENYFNR